MWQERYGRAYDEHGYANADFVPPAMRMPLAEAIALLKVPANYTKDDILAAFRREAKKAHPDVGGTAEMFEALVKARDRLLAALGTSAPAPKPPRYAPKGVQTALRHPSTLAARPASALLGGWPKCYQVRRWLREEDSRPPSWPRGCAPISPTSRRNANVDGSLSPG